MNKLISLISLVFFPLISHSQTIITCSSPLVLEGELVLSMSADRTEAQVSLNGIETYPTRIVSVGGPVQTFDFDTSFGTERLIYAVGGHELHRLDSKTGHFIKVGDLNCEKSDISDAPAAKLLSIRISPATDSIEILDGNLKAVFRSASSIGKRGSKDQATHQIKLKQTESKTLIEGILPDGIYKIVAGQHIAQNPSSALVSIQNGKVTSVSQDNERGFKGDFTIEMDCVSLLK